MLMPVSRGIWTNTKVVGIFALFAANGSLQIPSGSAIARFIWIRSTFLTRAILLAKRECLQLRASVLSACQIPRSACQIGSISIPLRLSGQSMCMSIASDSCKKPSGTNQYTAFILDACSCFNQRWSSCSTYSIRTVLD